MDLGGSKHTVVDIEAKRSHVHDDVVLPDRVVRVDRIDLAIRFHIVSVFVGCIVGHARSPLVVYRSHTLMLDGLTSLGNEQKTNSERPIRTYIQSLVEDCTILVPRRRPSVTLTWVHS